MACRISELVLECRDPEVLARFWCEVLDFVVLDREEEATSRSGRAKGSAARSRRSSSAATTSRRTGKPGCTSTSTPPTAIRTPSSSASWPPGPSSVDIGQTGEESWHVLADPEGNEFCLLKTRLDPL